MTTQVLQRERRSANKNKTKRDKITIKCFETCMPDTITCIAESSKIFCVYVHIFWIGIVIIIIYIYIDKLFCIIQNNMCVYMLAIRETNWKQDIRYCYWMLEGTGIGCHIQERLQYCQFFMSSFASGFKVDVWDIWPKD